VKKEEGKKEDGKKEEVQDVKPVEVNQEVKLTSSIMEVEGVIYEVKKDSNDQEVSKDIQSILIDSMFNHLVKQLTLDTSFLEYFFYTFTYIYDPMYFLDQFIERFYCLAPLDSDLDHFKEHRRWTFVYRRHIREIMDIWIGNHIYYFVRNPILEQRLTSFIEAMGDIQPGIADNTLLLISNSKKEWLSSHNNLYLSVPFYFKEKSEKLPSTGSETIDEGAIFKWSPKDIAKQLTLLEHGLMRMINYDEFLETRWRKPNKNEIAPNMSIMVDWFNNITQWIETEILIVNSINKRVQKLTHLIQVADFALKFRNYNLVKEICSALVSPTVDALRLKETWSKIKSSELKKLENMQSILDNNLNFANYRQAIKNDNTRPVVPFLGVVFGDINALEEILKTKDNGYYNLKKLKKVSERIREFKDHISGKYKYSENFEFIEWFAKERIIVEDKNEKYELSYKCEASKRTKKVETLPTTTETPSPNGEEKPSN